MTDVPLTALELKAIAAGLDSLDFYGFPYPMFPSSLFLPLREKIREAQERAEITMRRAYEEAADGGKG